MECREYDFDERSRMSQSESSNLSIAEILVGQIPGAVNAHQSHETNDRNGVDWWVEHSSGKHIGVDCKVREEDWSKKGFDDVALELWSVVEKKVVGWTLNESKRTDYILWFWRDTGRWMLIPFPFLVAVFKKNLNNWMGLYKKATQRTVMNGFSYHSECVFVPRQVIWQEIYTHFSGRPKN
jgi:hypothetical protein